MVGEERLELSRVSPLAPKANVYANFTTRPLCLKESVPAAQRGAEQAGPPVLPRAGRRVPISPLAHFFYFKPQNIT